jgi:hypothetical protein
MAGLVPAIRVCGMLPIGTKPAHAGFVLCAAWLAGIISCPNSKNTSAVVGRAADKPRLGPAAIASIAFEAAKRAIEAYRKDNLFIDLFQSRIGTVSYTELNGEGIFGSNSTSPTYTSHDRAAATVLRDRLVEKYPAVMNTDQLGRRPNEALFHAETTILLRASRASGGSVSGRTLEIYSDRRLCSSCESVLPYVGIELGNPSVIFIQPNGQRRTMRNGSWVD